MTSEKTFDRADIRPDWLMEQSRTAFARDIAHLAKGKPNFVVVPCPACAAGEAAPAFEKNGFSFVSCESCNTIYMSPRPSPAIIADYYGNSENYRLWADHIFPATEQTRRDKIHEPRLARLNAYCEQNKSGRDILVEVGPGVGSFAELAVQSKSFKRVIAVDHVPEMAAARRARNGEVVEKPIERAAAEGDLPAADVVVSFECLERLFEPAVLIQAAHRVLKPNGLLVISCPNAEGFDTLILGPQSPAVDAEHLNLFNPRSLSLLLGRFGFAVLDLETPGHLDADIVRDAVLNGEFDLGRQPFLEKILVTEWDRCGRAFQSFLAVNGLSGHMWCVARKATGEG